MMRSPSKPRMGAPAPTGEAIRDKAARRLRDIPFSGIRAIYTQAEALERQGKDIIHLEIGRPDFDTPQVIKQAAEQGLRQGVVHYTANRGLLDLRQAIAEKLRLENGIEADPETEIIVTVGAGEAVLAALLAYLDPEDEIILPDPAWPHYASCAALAMAKPIYMPLREENGFVVDPDELRDLVSPRTKMLVINSPHNPTGAMIDQERIEAIAEIVQAHDLILLSDEIYERIRYGELMHCSPAALPGMSRRTLTVNGFSKAFSMTGWRVGYIVGHAALLDPILKVHQYGVTCATSFAQYGAATAYREAQQAAQDMVQIFQERREALLKGLRAMEGVTCVEPQGSFYAFPNFSRLGLSSQQLAAHLLQEAHVALVPGSAFGERGEGHLRIAFCNSLERIEQATQRIQEALIPLAAGSA